MTLTRFLNLILLDLPNCIGLLETGPRSLLNISLGPGHNCSFKLTQEEHDAAACWLESVRIGGCL